MPRLYHPRTGKPVDVPAHERSLLRYYRREGYTDAPDAPLADAIGAALPEPQATALVDAYATLPAEITTNAPGDEPGESITDPSSPLDEEGDQE